MKFLKIHSHIFFSLCQKYLFWFENFYSFYFAKIHNYSHVHKEWDVYSDVAKKASMSVALKKNKKNREILYVSQIKNSR